MGIFRLKFKKKKNAIVTFEATLIFSKSKFFENLKSLSLGPKSPYSSVLGSHVLRKLLSNLKSVLKFAEKQCSCET